MKKKYLLLSAVLAILIGATIVYAAVWSTYTEMSSGTLVDGDDFLVRDISDTTTMSATEGAQFRIKWSSMKVAMGLTPIEFLIDGGGSAITEGIKGDIEIAATGTISRATMLCDVSTTTVVDIWVDTYANYPPTNADSITSATPPTVTAALKSQDSTLTSWTTSITAGSIMRFNVDSNNNATRCTVSLMVQK